MKDGRLYINGEPVKRERVDDYFGESSCGGGADVRSSAGRRRCRAA